MLYSVSESFIGTSLIFLLGSLFHTSQRPFVGWVLTLEKGQNKLNEQTSYR